MKCLCLNTDYDPATGVVRVSFVSETDAKYPFAMGQSSTAPVPPVLTPVDPAYVSPPLPEEWVITPRPPSGGSLLPGFDLSGAVGNSTATAIEVEYWEVPAVVDPNDAPPEDAFWKSAGTWPPTASTIPIDVQADRYYWIGLTYIRAQNYSARTITGPYLAGQLIAGDVSPTAPTIAALNAEIAALEALQASETVIREEQVDRLEARSSFRANLIDNPSGLADFRSWIKEGGPASSTIDDAQLGRMFSVTDYMVSKVYPAAPGHLHSLGFNAYPAANGAHLRIQYITPAGLAEGALVAVGSADVAERRRSSAASVAPAGTTGFRIVVAPPTGAALKVWAVKVNFGDEAVAFSDDYSATVLEASVTDQALAIIDLETGQALAKFELVAAAAGGKPARFRLVSSSLAGSAIALDADYIYLGPNTVTDTTTNTEQTTVGGRLRVTAKGAPFGVGGNLLEWWGPTGIALSDMTPANGYNGRMTTAPYVFDNMGPGFSARANSSRATGSRSGAGSVTTGAIVITPTGATATVEYRWWYISGDTSLVIGTTSGGASATWQTTLSALSSKSAVWGWSATMSGQSHTGIVEVLAQAL
ncbi:hypothetical protein D3C72_943030 [compost metagenome]